MFWWHQHQKGFLPLPKSHVLLLNFMSLNFKENPSCNPRQASLQQLWTLGHLLEKQCSSSLCSHLSYYSSPSLQHVDSRRHPHGDTVSLISWSILTLASDAGSSGKGNFHTTSMQKHYEVSDVHHQLSYSNRLLFIWSFGNSKCLGEQKEECCRSSLWERNEKAVRQTGLQSVQEQQANPEGSHCPWRVPAGAGLGLELQSMKRSPRWSMWSIRNFGPWGSLLEQSFSEGLHPVVWFPAGQQGGCKEDGAEETKYYGLYCVAQRRVREELGAKLTFLGRRKRCF